MFSIGFFMMFCLAFAETIKMKRIATLLEVKNFMTFVSGFTAFIISAAIFLAIWYEYPSGGFLDENLDVFSDWRFYVALISETLGLYIARRNYEMNGNNITAINFALFFSLVLVPIYSFFFSSLFGFKDTIEINFQSQLEFWIFVGFMLVLTITFFADKLKGKIRNVGLLCLLPIILSNSMFFTGKLMQTYEGFFVYALITLNTSIIFLTIGFQQGEWRRLERKHLRPALFISGIWAMAIPLNTLAVKVLAVEFVTLLKRVSQIISGVIVDKIYKNHEASLSVKDRWVVGLMLASGLTLYWLRG